ncbi:hypothetical protein THOB06_60141 [Vibrio rotiferianus]|nr:hypothetical protein THOG10_60141 [Vibrio rotiferianus]CAH1593624.1 hypothetical protein THOB06_60141 [Vibrio rotiferianus]
MLYISTQAFINACNYILYIKEFAQGCIFTATRVSGYQL